MVEEEVAGNKEMRQERLLEVGRLGGRRRSERCSQKDKNKERKKGTR